MLKCGRLLRQAEAEVVRITNRGHAAVFCFPLIVALRSIHSFIPCAARAVWRGEDTFSFRLSLSVSFLYLKMCQNKSRSPKCRRSFVCDLALNGAASRAESDSPR